MLREFKKSERPRLLFIVPLPPPVHGAALRNKSLIESKLLNDTFQIDCVPFNFAKTSSDVGKFSFIKILKSVQRGFQITTRIISFRPHAVYFNLSLYGFAKYRDFAYVLACKMLGRKLIFHLRTQGVSAQVQTSVLARRMFRFIFRHSKIICLSNFLTRDVAEVYDEKPFVVNNGIEDIPVRYQQKRTHSNDVPVILFLANLAVAKGLLELLDALVKLRESRIPFKAQIVGSPVDLSIDNLTARITTLGISDCTFILGPKHGFEKFDILYNSDVYVLPTHFEAFPGTVLEAMQFELPVISTFEGAIPEIVDENKTGLLCRKNNVRDLAQKLELLMANPTLRRTLGANGRKKYLEQYTLGIFERNMKLTFEKILTET